MSQDSREKSLPCRAPEGLATARVRRRIEPLMRDWYGDGAEAEGASMDFLPRTQNISDVMNRVSKKLFPAYLMNLQRVQREWASIAGERAAAFSCPSFLADGVLNIEVSHPAYRSALESASVRAAILSKVCAICGDSVRELRFIPGGRRQKTSDAKSC